MIVDGVRSLSGAVGGRKTKISHTPSCEIFQLARYKRGGRCGYGVKEYGMESGRAERMAVM